MTALFAVWLLFTVPPVIYSVRSRRLARRQERKERRADLAVAAWAEVVSRPGVTACGGYLAGGER